MTSLSTVAQASDVLYETIGEGISQMKSHFENYEPSLIINSARDLPAGYTMEHFPGIILKDDQLRLVRHAKEALLEVNSIKSVLANTKAWLITKPMCNKLIDELDLFVIDRPINGNKQDLYHLDNGKVHEALKKYRALMAFLATGNVTKSVTELPEHVLTRKTYSKEGLMLRILFPGRCISEKFLTTQERRRSGAMRLQVTPPPPEKAVAIMQTYNLVKDLKTIEGKKLISKVSTLADLQAISLGALAVRDGYGAEKHFDFETTRLKTPKEPIFPPFERVDPGLIAFSRYFAIIFPDTFYYMNEKEQAFLNSIKCLAQEWDAKNHLLSLLQ